MFSRILSALLVLAVASPAAVLAQSPTPAQFSAFAESITAVDTLVSIANSTGAGPSDFKCIALVAADAVAVGAVGAAKGTALCPAAAAACSVANGACVAAKCSGCLACPAC